MVIHPDLLRSRLVQLDSHFKPNNLKISFFLTKGIPMFKVTFSIRTPVLFAAERLTEFRRTRNCRICGNGFLPLNASARTCEFCKTPFGGIVSGVVLSALSNAAAS